MEEKYSKEATNQTLGTKSVISKAYVGQICLFCKAGEQQYEGKADK